jgi:hypothetical protein
MASRVVAERANETREAMVQKMSERGGYSITSPNVESGEASYVEEILEVPEGSGATV